MELANNGDFWDGYSITDAKGFLRSAAVGVEHPARIAVDEFFVGEKKPITILEVPSGGGVDVDMLSKHGVVTCVDKTKVMLDAVKEQHPSIDIIQADIRALPLKDNSFDWVHARAIFEHLPSFKDVELAMQECFRVAKKGCIFAFFIPPDEKEDIVWNGQFFNNQYKKQDMVDAFRKMGVKTIREEYILAPNHLDNFLIFFVRKV